MSALDWWVLLLTQVGIVIYGLYAQRRADGSADYLRGRNMGWFTVGLSIMATQASAITFLSAPGLAYTEGMRFVQFYFGLPIAMVIIATVAVPLYYRMNVITAYEYLEHRFDVRLRTLAAFLFLTQRGLAAGLTIFAPALILSAVLHVNLSLTCLAIGAVVVGYTLTGGTTAVARTQKTQMAIILAAMVWAAWLVVDGLPNGVGIGEALAVADAMGRMQSVDWRFDWNEKYTVWSGLLGGTFLMLSYFGTDQSQVQRYLGGQTIQQSRMGLMMNGLLKIPMQYGILLVGVFVFVFYIFQPAPLLFNTDLRGQLVAGKAKVEFQTLETEYKLALNERKTAAINYLDAQRIGGAHSMESTAVDLETAGGALNQSQRKIDTLRSRAQALAKKELPDSDSGDTNYIFLYYVFERLPSGIIGLIVSMILAASMSSTSSELNALAATTVVDVYKRLFRPNADDAECLRVSRWSTLAWGIYAILFSMIARHLGTLIEAVNLLGSLVYGVILGVFLCAFLLKRVTSGWVLGLALVNQGFILVLFWTDALPFLWFNLIGAMGILIPAALVDLGLFVRKKSFQV
jgi:Na+/proline symporter